MSLAAFAPTEDHTAIAAIRNTEHTGDGSHELQINSGGMGVSQDMFSRWVSSGTSIRTAGESHRLEKSFLDSSARR